MSDTLLSHLQDYKAKYPEVIVLDPPEAILQLRNRQSMLQDVAQLNLCHLGGELFLSFGTCSCGCLLDALYFVDVGENAFVFKSFIFAFLSSVCRL